VIVELTTATESPLRRLSDNTLPTARQGSTLRVNDLPSKNPQLPTTIAFSIVVGPFVFS